MKFLVFLRSLFNSTYNKIPQSNQSECTAITAGVYLPVRRIRKNLQLRSSGSRLESLSDTTRRLSIPLVDDMEIKKDHR